MSINAGRRARRLPDCGGRDVHPARRGPTILLGHVALASVQAVAGVFWAVLGLSSGPGRPGTIGGMDTRTDAAHFMDRVLDPLAGSLNVEAARRILALDIDPEVQARVAILAELANEGELTPDERDEYLSYVEAADMLAIFQLKAERRLQGGER